MVKELVINSNPHGVEVALLEDKKLVEIHQEKTDNEFNVGDIFLGKIKRIMPGLNAAFVDVGHEKDAFLHYTDLSPDFRTLAKFTGQAVAGHSDGTLNNLEMLPEIEKTGNVKEVLAGKGNVLVQILKEPISTKGPRLTCEITLAGRYLVLSPFSNSVGVSKKIESADERKRLKVLVESLKPKNFGVIVRTVAAGKDAKTLHEDLRLLEEKWKEMSRNLRGAQPVKKVLSELDKTSGLLRDLLSPEFNRVVTNNSALAKELESYIERIAPDKKGIVSTYNGKVPIFDQFGITKQVKAIFGRQVNLGNGIYLVIDKTEACHVIDVNSGNRSSQEGTQETNALQVNLEACDEIARQLRLRDMGGIIIIDFIDMKNPEFKRQVQERLRVAMEQDKATHTILPLSKFNILQLTRERVRPEVNIVTEEECPTCGGSGKIGSPLLILDEIQSDVGHLLETHPDLRLYLHPIMAAYLKKGFPSIRMRWFFQYKRWVRIYTNENFPLTEYKFFDAHDEEIVTA
ncbi:MAG: Rne/Rng family ribonuclease [Chitinophagales bacterium]